MDKFHTVTEAWFHYLGKVLNGRESYEQYIQRGSFSGEAVRLQLPFTACTIEKPLLDFVPTVPEGVAPPNSREYVEKYFCDYIVGAKPSEDNEEYTYAERVKDQLQIVLDMLKDSPYTNQATVEVGRPSDITSSDPACLRTIDFKVVDEKVEITTFWRSNDLWAGFPSNLGAMGMLQQMVAEYVGREPGDMHYASSGLHLYSYQINSALAKLGKTKPLEEVP